MVHNLTFQSRQLFNVSVPDRLCARSKKSGDMTPIILLFLGGLCPILPV